MQITHHRFGGSQAIGLCLIVALVVVAGNAMLQPAHYVHKYGIEFANNASLKDRQESTATADWHTRFADHGQAPPSPDADTEPPVHDEELAEAATLRESVDVLSLVNAKALLGLLKGQVALLRDHIAKAIRTPNTLLIDRTFANVDQSSRQQIDNFLAGFRYSQHAHGQGYIAALKRASAEFTSTKHIVSCGTCWCTVVDEPLTD
jgi:hypothetical protein